MKKTWIFLTLITLLLAACQMVPPTPAATSAPNTATPAPALATKALEPSPTPLPTLVPTLVPMATPTQALPSAFTCAEFPGWSACRGAQAPLPLKGALAWVSAEGGTLTAVNFSSGAVWRAPVKGITRLAWSPDKTRLLAVDGEGALLYPMAGGAAARSAEKTAQGWFPAGVELPAGWVVNANGGSAHLETKDNLTVAKIRLAFETSAEFTFPLTPAPSDRLFRLLLWLPGTDLVLGQGYYAANSMWVLGGQLFTLDVKTGAVKWFEAYTPLGAIPSASPTQPGLLALAESASGGQRLATLDTLTGKLTILTTDDSVFVSHPAWSADGKAILFAGWALPLEQPAGAPFDLRAIYLTSPTGGPLVRLTQPPAGALDDAPQVLAGGKYFLFVRHAVEGTSAEVRLGGLDGVTDLPVVKGVLLPACQPQPGCANAVWSYLE